MSPPQKLLLLLTAVFDVTLGSFQMPFYFASDGDGNNPGSDKSYPLVGVSLQVKIDDDRDDQSVLSTSIHSLREIASATVSKWEEVRAFGDIPENDSTFKRWMEDAVHDALEARQTARQDACFGRDEIWGSIDLEGLNAYDVLQDISPRRTRVGDAPMLRSLRSQKDFPDQLRAMKLNGYWAELGVLKGDFSVHLMKNGDLKSLYMVDKWESIDIYTQEDADNNLRSARDQASHYGKEGEDFHIVKMDSTEAAKQFPDGFFDYIHIDAGHTYADVRNDLEHWWSTLKVGGLMSGDDYKNGFVQLAGYSFGVKDAVDEFFGKKNHRVYMTEGDDLHLQWYVMKCE